jgi:hypothetical protein
LDDEFVEFCNLNNITDIDKKAKETFDRGFTILKFGEIPQGKRVIEKVEVPIEVEKIVEIEKIVEVPIEVIKEVIKEVRVEVPVEVIKEVVKQGKTKTVTKEVIKEVPVERIVEVTKEVINNEQLEKLQKENSELKAELDKITTALTKVSKAKFMKNSDMSSLYDE